MKLLERLVLVCRRRRRRGMVAAADAYSGWVQQFLTFAAVGSGAWTAPANLGTADVEAFLNHLVGQRRLPASRRNQVLNALIFLDRHARDAIPHDHLGKFTLQRATRPRRDPAVPSAGEVARPTAAPPEARNVRLMAELLYGTGTGEISTALRPG